MPELKIIDSAVLISSSDLDNTVKRSHWGGKEKENERKQEGINLQCYSECCNRVHESYGSPLDLPVAIHDIISMHFSITTGSAEVLVSMLRMS